MGLLLGARDLGLNIEWRFGFVGVGMRAEPTPGVLYLDVGGRVCPGILDHHGRVLGAESAADLVFRRPEAVYNHLLGPWLARLEQSGIPDGTRWTPTIVVHREPDFDTVAAAVLAIRLAEDGELPPWAEALACYSRDVDQGRYAVIASDEDSKFALHLAYLVIQNLPSTRGFEAQLRRGIALVEAAMARVGEARRSRRLPIAASAQDLCPGSPGAVAWSEDPANEDIKAVLDEEPARYARDRRRATFLESVLPVADGAGTVTVRTLVSPTYTESVLNKYWVRADGFPYFICPVPHPAQGPTVSGAPAGYARVVLSLDPNWTSPDGRKPSLQGLGYALERLESQRRRHLGGGLDDRGGAPRYDGGYCDNADPWYDGRGHHFTIVDAPRAGSRLAYDDIVDLATRQRFWQVPLESAVLTLVWVDEQEDTASDAGAPLVPFDGMAGTLETLYRESREFGESPPPLPRLPAGCTVAAVRRIFPRGTSPSMRVITVEAGQGVTLESLIDLRADVVSAAGSAPTYALSRVIPAKHFGPDRRFDSLIRALADADVQPLPAAADDRELILFNSRTLLIRQPARVAAASGRDPDLEILLYVAFLNESLIRFSRRISQLVPRDDAHLHRLDSSGLRRDFLRFQTAYFQMEVSRHPRGRMLAERLVDALKLHAHYGEVQSELDRLAQLEDRLEDERRERADSIMQFVLYLVAVAGVLQTLVAFYALPAGELWAWRLWRPVGGVVLAAFAIYGLIELYKRRR